MKELSLLALRTMTRILLEFSLPVHEPIESEYSISLSAAPRPSTLLPSSYDWHRFLKNRFKQANDAAIKKLSSLRALHRLNVASSWGCAVRARQPGSWGDDKSSPNDSPEEVGVAGASAAEDPHPHITALATVFGEASKLMARLAESNLGQNVEEPVARLVHEESKAQVRL